jgi:hypothetical protein
MLINYHFPRRFVPVDVWYTVWMTTARAWGDIFFSPRPNECASRQSGSIKKEFECFLTPACEAIVFFLFRAFLWKAFFFKYLLQCSKVLDRVFVRRDCWAVDKNHIVSLIEKKKISEKNVSIYWKVLHRCLWFLLLWHCILTCTCGRYGGVCASCYLLLAFLVILCFSF